MQTIDELNGWLNQHHLAGLWAGMAGEKPLTPFLWKWADIEEGVKAATHLVPIDSGGRRTAGVDSSGVQNEWPRACPWKPTRTTSRELHHRAWLR